MEEMFKKGQGFMNSTTGDIIPANDRKRIEYIFEEVGEPFEWKPGELNAEEQLKRLNDQIQKNCSEEKIKVNSKKVYLVKLYYRNTDEYEDFRDDSTIVTAFSKKESAERYLKDSIALFKSCVKYGLQPAYDNGVKDAMTDVKWSCTMNEGVTNISLLQYFTAFKDGKYDPDGDRNDPKNWSDFWAMDFTEFEFTIEEMEVFD